jgi:hypothetical protein
MNTEQQTTQIYTLYSPDMASGLTVATFVILRLEIVQWALCNSDLRVVRAILGRSFEMWG